MKTKKELARRRDVKTKKELARLANAHKRQTKKEVVRLGRSHGLSGVKALEFYRRSRCTPMHCALCAVANAEHRFYTPGPEGLHAVGVCSACRNKPSVAADVRAELNRRERARLDSLANDTPSRRTVPAGSRGRHER